MADQLLILVTDALVQLVEYVATRPATATDDDDVRALEDVGFALSKADGDDRVVLRSLLGRSCSEALGVE